MWSDKSVSIAARDSASLLYNNLSSTAKYCAFAHRHQVNIVELTALETKVLKIKDEKVVTQVRYISADGQPYLVITTFEGAQIWNCDGTKAIDLFSLSDNLDIHSDMSYCRGIGYIDASSKILVGSSVGTILSYQINDGAAEFSGLLKGHKASVTAISEGQDIIASADDTGAIITWKCDNLLSQDLFIDGYGSPVTSIICQEKRLIASYSTGHIRIFRPSTGNIAIEIAAHARCITALAALDEQYIASIGEDTYLNVWDLGTAGNIAENDIKLVTNVRSQDNVLTGVTFTKKEEDILTTSYDSSSVQRWCRN